MMDLDCTPNLVLYRSRDHIVAIEPNVDAFVHETVAKLVDELCIRPGVRYEATVDQGSPVCPCVEDSVLEVGEARRG